MPVAPRRLASKRPLIGESHALETQIHHQAGAGEVTVSASPVYAAIQQFGGKKSEFPHLWGDIPARPFLPVRPDGTLYPAEQAAILADINDYLTAR
jgi:phage gpG-like protein